jgi:hypothetical protein
LVRQRPQPLAQTCPEDEGLVHMAS